MVFHLTVRIYRILFSKITHGLQPAAHELVLAPEADPHDLITNAPVSGVGTHLLAL